MSVKITAQLNPFSSEITKYEEFSETTIQNILKKIDARNAVNTGWRVLINDTPITDFNTSVNDGDNVYIKIVPEGDNKDSGKGMKVGGGVLVAIGIITSFFLPPLGGALIGAGVGLFAGGVVLYNMEIPSLESRKSPEQDPSIRGSRNQKRERGYIPILFGRRRIYSDLAMSSFTWVEPETGSQYLYQLFCAGQKDQKIEADSIKIDETLLSDYSSSGKIESVLNGKDELIEMKISYGEDCPPLITKCVHEEQINSQLVNKTKENTDGAIIRTTPNNTTEINVDIFFYNGLGKYDDEGKLKETSVEIKAEYKQADESDSAYKLLGYFDSKSSTNTISGKELKTKRFAITKSGLKSDSYTVRLTRVTADSSDSKIVDAVYVGSIRAVKNESPVSQKRCKQLTLIGLKIKASEKLNSVIDRLNFISQSILPVYDGTNNSSQSWKENALSSNPASAAIYAMRGEMAQQKLNENDIDWQSFAKLYNWCKNHKYECNAYVSDSITIQQLLSQIASTCRAEITRINGKITVIQDIERDSFVQMFSPRNSWDYSEQIALSDIPDKLCLPFVNAECGYAEDEAYVYNTPDGNKGNSEAITSQDLTLWGVTDKNQALKLGMYSYAVTKNRPIIHKFSTDIEYMLCRKGDWIKYAGDIALAGITQGRLSEIIRNTEGKIIGVKTDEELPMENGKLYALRIRKSDGCSELLQIETVQGFYNQVFFITPQDSTLGIAEGNLFYFGTVNNDSIDLVITDITCGENLSAELTCVEYAPEIFDVDNDGFKLPEFESKITAIPGAIDAGDYSNQSLPSPTYEDLLHATEQINESIKELEAPITVTCDCPYISVLVDINDEVMLEQKYAIKFNVQQGEKTIDFTFGKISGLPSGFTTKDNNNGSLEITIASGNRFTNASLMIPISYTYKDKEISSIFVIGMTSVKGGKYLGLVSALPTVSIIGDYLVWSAESTAKMQKGGVYTWNGKDWILDENENHIMTAMSDILSLKLEEIPNKALKFIENFATNLAFISHLFANQITLQQGADGEPSFIQGISADGTKSWKICSNGHAEFNDVQIGGYIPESTYNKDKQQTEKDINSAKTEAINSANNNTTDKLKDYTKTENLSDVAISGDYSDLAGKPSIPSKTSELTNNSGFQTANDVSKEISNLVEKTQPLYFYYHPETSDYTEPPEEWVTGEIDGWRTIRYIPKSFDESYFFYTVQQSLLKDGSILNGAVIEDRTAEEMFKNKGSINQAESDIEGIQQSISTIKDNYVTKEQIMESYETLYWWSKDGNNAVPSAPTSDSNVDKSTTGTKQWHSYPPSNPSDFPHIYLSYRYKKNGSYVYSKSVSVWGATLIKDGKLVTNLIDVDALFANHITLRDATVDTFVPVSFNTIIELTNVQNEKALLDLGFSKQNSILSLPAKTTCKAAEFYCDDSRYKTKSSTVIIIYIYEDDDWRINLTNLASGYSGTSLFKEAVYFMSNSVEFSVPVKKGGVIHSENYNGTFANDNSISSYGTQGWAIDKKGTADFVGMHAVGGTFENMNIKGKLITDKGFFFNHRITHNGDNTLVTLSKYEDVLATFSYNPDRLYFNCAGLLNVNGVNIQVHSISRTYHSSNGYRVDDLFFEGVIIVPQSQSSARTILNITDDIVRCLVNISYYAGGLFFTILKYGENLQKSEYINKSTATDNLLLKGYCLF